jgi:hypothetical protein
VLLLRVGHSATSGWDQSCQSRDHFAAARAKLSCSCTRKSQVQLQLYGQHNASAASVPCIIGNTVPRTHSSLPTTCIPTIRRPSVSCRWLAHLTLLTSIDIRYYVPAFPDPHAFSLLHAQQDPDPWHLHDAPSANGGAPTPVAIQHPDDSPFCLRALDEVVQAVPHMRALHNLRIAGEYPPEQLLRLFFTQASFQKLASARRTLRSLHLGHAHWNSHAMATISMLRGLTSLTLDRCLDLGEYSYWGLASLAELRALRYQPKAPGHELPRELVAGLTNLEALALRDGCVDAGYLAALGASLQRLTALDVSCEPGWLEQKLAGNAGGCAGGLGLAVTALWKLARLEVVDLAFAVEGADLGRIQAPPSLRRCYLGGGVAAEGRQEARAVLGRHVDVRFERSAFC